MNKKGHDLQNFGQFKDETPLNSIQISGFWGVKMSEKIEKDIVCRYPSQSIFGTGC